MILHLIIYHEGKGIHQCEICKYNLRSEQLLQEHYKQKHPECFQIYCIACRVAFKNHEQFQRHEEECCLKSKFQCRSCLCAFRSKHSLILHFTLRSHNGLVCRRCKELFTDLEEFIEHSNTAHKNVRKYTCKVCNLEFSSGKKLFIHRERVHDRFERLCSVCGWKTMRNSLFKEHMRIHERGGVRCEICGHPSTNKTKRAQHMASHQPYACPKCNYVILGANRMRQHFSVCRGSEFLNESITLAEFDEMNKLKSVDEFHCHGCNKDIKTSAVRHFNGSRKCSELHRCKYCSLMFEETESLRNHEVSHTGPFFCQECSRGFIYWDKVCEHMKHHAKEQRCKSKFRIFKELNDTDICDEDQPEEDSVVETVKEENDDDEESISDKELENTEREEQFNGVGTKNVKMEESVHYEGTELIDFSI